MASIDLDGPNWGLQVGVNNGSIYASPGRPETPPHPLSTVPFCHDPDFISRGTILDEIFHKGVIPGSRIALVGLGGVGKSQLAIEYSHQVRAQSPNTWVFWIHASNSNRFKQSCEDIADRVKIPGRQNPKANIYKLLHDWLHDERKGKWVLIVDNLDDDQFLHEPLTVEQDGEGSGRSILTYFPQSLGGLILITSRNKRAVSSIVEETDIIPVEPMDETHANLLLERKLAGQAFTTDEALQLITALDFMPLAIAQAAAYIKQRTPYLSVPKYLQEFQNSDHEKAGLLDYDRGQLRRDREAKNSILITWQLSFNHIQRIRSSATDLISLMSFFDRQNIPKGLLRYQGGDEDDADSALDHRLEDDLLILRDYSLVSISIDGSTFEMHRLVQLATRKWIEAHGKIDWWRSKFIEILNQEFPDPVFERWAVCKTLFPHVKSVLTQRPKWNEEKSIEKWADLLSKAAEYAFLQGDSAECHLMADLAAEATKRVFGLNDMRTCDCLDMLGLAFILKHQWGEAEKLFVHVIAMTKQLLAPEHPRTVSVIGNLGFVYEKQDKLKEAEKLFIHAMDMSQRVIGPEHQKTVRIMGSLALVYKRQGKLKEAEELGLRVMEILKRVTGLEHPDTLDSMSSLAFIYRSQGKLDESERLCSDAMEISKKAIGPEHPITLTLIGNLSSIYQDQGELKKAENLRAKTMETYKRVLGLHHPSTLASMSMLAFVYQCQGKLKESEKLCSDAIEISKQVIGPEHPDTLILICNLSSIYEDQGELKKAENLRIETIEICKRVVGLDNPFTLDTMANLASVYLSQGRYEEAKGLWTQVMEVSERTMGRDHRDTLNALYHLAHTSWLLSEHESAIQMMSEHTRLLDQHLGPVHPQTASLLLQPQHRRGIDASSAHTNQVLIGRQDEQTQNVSMGKSTRFHQPTGGHQSTREILSRFFRRK
ncbi:P-loop containing nucleoside triphosphate hydrolase protein [Penicillium taxi]|uniref:P-loop containing nucleoside triphosphate hydrolase protein n=1 Tax=Penicillium taxi TaxID=168475 RepID=UPI002545A61D|nr:P-loop containing nucleoside triphosphate hydrolase protein [Penicillium taxi]KAJ5895130.1 P-loop containing nucleoside triphosphate hydrolase protein [Penicillium taxi]